MFQKRLASLIVIEAVASMLLRSSHVICHGVGHY